MPKTILKPRTTVTTKKASAKTAPKRSAPAKKTLSSESVTTNPTQRPAPLRLSSAWQLTKITARLLWGSKWIFLGILVLYAVINIILAQGLAQSTDIGTLKQQLGSAFHGQFGTIGSSLTIFVSLIGSAGSTSNSSGGSAYQIILLLIVSLALIWALRQISTGTSVHVRDAYYRGIYPLIPFVLVLIVIGIQLLPLLIGTTIYGAVISNDLAVYLIEKILWFGLFAAFAFATLYLLSSSLFALYIVTLPDMAPMQALRSARLLVHKRRWSIIRRVLFLPVMLAIVGAIIMVPVILIIAPIAQYVFFIITLLAIVAAHGYMYSLYKDLLRVS